MKKIAIIGPESTGKSTLCKGLAAHFQEPLVPEYGRIYLEQNGANYQESDLLKITEGMLEAEQKQAANTAHFLFCDTDLVMMKVWYEVKYNHCPSYILNKLSQKPYDFHLLCAPDLPWVDDPFRENPSIRQELFNQYQKELESYRFDHAIIKGQEKRLERAINAVEKIQ